MNLRRQMINAVVFIMVLACFSVACEAYKPTIKASGNGGIVVVQVIPDCPVSEVLSVTLYALEASGFHKTRWKTIAHMDVQSHNEFIFNWDTTTCHDNTYTLKAEIKLKSSILVAKTQVKISNLSILCCYPDNVIIKTDEETPASITVVMADNDLDDPKDVEVKIYKLEKHNRPIRVLNASGVKGDKISLTWDLKDSRGEMTETAPYTFEVTVAQTDTFQYAGQDLAVKDTCTYRSKYLKIEPVRDKNGVPMLDWAFLGYSSKGTKTESDDTYLDSIHFYLKDSLGMNAVSGRMYATNPDFTKKLNYTLGKLTCKVHKRNDCLRAAKTGIHHQACFEVPTSFFEYAGSYYSCLEVFDNHAVEYRDHTARRALNF